MPLWPGRKFTLLIYRINITAMLREREIREEFLKTGQIAYYEHLRQNKRGKTTDLLSAFHDLFCGKHEGEIECHDKRLVRRFGSTLKKNLPLFRLLRAVCLQGGESMLSHPEIQSGIGALSKHLHTCVREPEAWRCPKGNFQIRFRHLVRHLFARFNVPEFMDRVWMEPENEPQEFYIDLGKGVPVYGHDFLKEAKMSRKTAHWFRQAPANSTVIQAVRWAQIRTIRKEKRLYRTVSHSFLGKDLSNDVFWSGAIQWLMKQKEVDCSLVRPLLRFVNYLKYGKFQLGNVLMPLPAPDPDFSFSGRTFSSVIKAMRDFETSIKMDRDQESTSWAPAPFPDFDWDKHPETGSRISGFRMVQIVNYNDLVQEGVLQKHCVATYSKTCLNGNTSIWSLRLGDKDHERPLVTVELMNTGMVVNQVKGLNNRLADQFEAKMVLDWASHIGAQVPEWSLS
jgi:hypothetical protein